MLKPSLLPVLLPLLLLIGYAEIYTPPLAAIA